MPLPSSVTTYINYYREPSDDEEAAVWHLQTAGFRRQKFGAQQVRVTDVRSCEQDFMLDVNGFQFVKSIEARYEAFRDDATIKAEVYAKARDLLIRETGATEAYIFNHIHRREPYQKHLELPKDIPDDQKAELFTPAVFAHVDQSPRGAVITLGNIPEAETYIPKTKTRWAIINIWVPLKEVTREPLALCDAQSVDLEDLRETTIVGRREDPPGKKGLYRMDNYLWQLAASHRSEHRWYYKSKMTPDEAILVKCFDSKLDGRARCAPHSAVVTPHDEGPARESVEFRCFVFWEDQPLEGNEKQFVVPAARDDWVPANL